MFGKKEGWVGVKACLRGEADSLRDLLGLKRFREVYLIFFSLCRMSGEYPNSVSICKYLQYLVLPLVTYQQSLYFHDTKDNLE